MIPHRCPICNGTGNVPGGFYYSTGDFCVSNCATETCRTCGGTGVIWEASTDLKRMNATQNAVIESVRGYCGSCSHYLWGWKDGGD